MYYLKKLKWTTLARLFSENKLSIAKLLLNKEHIYNKYEHQYSVNLIFDMRDCWVFCYTIFVTEKCLQYQNENNNESL